MGPGEIDLVKSVRARSGPLPLSPLLASSPAAAAAAAGAGGPTAVAGLQQFMQNLMFLLMDLVRPGSARGGRLGVPEARHLEDPVPETSGEGEGTPGGLKRLPMGEGRQRAVLRQKRRIGANMAHMFDALESWATRDGVLLRIVSGYRSWEDREMLDNRFGKGRTGVEGPDIHETGYAIDFANTPNAYAWLARHAPRLGFSCPDLEEPWHWVAGPR